MTAVVLLHNIRSLHNVGSIFRTADGAGIAKLFLCGITPEPLDRLGRSRTPLAKVALGAEKSVAWEKAASTSRTIHKLKKEGYDVIALEQSSGSRGIFQFEPKPAAKIALVLGEEVRGLTPAILKMCDQVLEIPMHGQKESLNVSVAFGIAAYHLIGRKVP